MRTVVLRVVALALLLLLALFGAIALHTMQRLPDTTIYFVRDQGTTFTLEAVHRKLGAAATLERVRAQVRALGQGPDAGEAAEGLSSAVPAGVTVRSARLAGDVLTVDLSADFERGGGTALMVGRLNQLFYTLTQPGDVAAVRLLIEGQAVEVFSGDGIIVEQPWVRAEQPRLPVW